MTRRTIAKRAKQGGSPALVLLTEAVKLHQKGRIEAAEKAYRRVLALAPNQKIALHLLGSLLLDHGQPDAAVPLLRRALDLDPGNIDTHNNLGVALQAIGRGDEAIVRYKAVLAADPLHVLAQNNLSSVFRNLGRYDEALLWAKRAILLKPDYPEAHNNAGSALHALGRDEEALAAFARAVALRPEDAKAQSNIGVVLRELGRLEQAIVQFDLALDLAPAIASHYRLRVEAAAFPADHRHLPGLKALEAARERLPVGDRIELAFACAKAYDDLADYPHSLDHLIEGNRLKRGQIAYDEAESFDRLVRIGRTFTADLLARKAPVGATGPVPIFIIGMPRSGSTLAEQVLASHPALRGLGETDLFAQAILPATGLDLVGNPDSAAELTPAQIEALGRRYGATIAEAAPGAGGIVNKMLENFHHLGLIHMALPQARFIHTMRDPIDTCLSCFGQLFISEQHYTFDLGELGRYYRAYEVLMAHWRRVLPAGTLFDLRYEDMVAEPEIQARRLVEHCGLPWDPACLDFWQTARAVRTASASQVRRPIYQSSIGRWRRYGPRLAPLFAALGLVMPNGI